jgi:mannose-6-phosphate isomerase-like protein (cupin superfamily)
MPSLFDRFVHLGLDARTVEQPPFDGMEWYQGYGERTAADGREGRLVSLYRFDADWDMWEMHPHGEELVLCTEGAMALILERPDGHVERLELGAGDYGIVPRGCWHSADVAGHATALFVTPGEGTAHKARQ